MSSKSYEFRSRSEREREVDLSRNYGQIGNKAVAAASQSCCKDKARKSEAKVQTPTHQHELATSH